jgi:copper chaperone
MDTMVLKVGGMSCGGCVKSVTTVLEALPGVAKADVSLANGEAVVTYEADKVSRERMVQVIDDAGFEAS